MVVWMCVALFWAILLAKPCVAAEEVQTLFVKETPLLDSQVLTLNQSKVVQDSNTKIAAHTCATPVDLQPLISSPPLLPILFAKSASKLLADQQCGKDAQKFLDELANGVFWAARVFDASARIPEGVLFGHKAHYGNFDGCYSGGTEDFGTRYCLVDYKYKQTTDRDNHNLYTDIGANNCTWDFLKVKPYIWAADISNLRMALCAPFSCTAKDIELCLEKALEDYFLEIAPTVNVPFSISVNPSNCQALNEQKDFSLGPKIFCGLFIALCVLIGVATWRYRPRIQAQGKQSLANSIVECFAAQKNIENLVQRNVQETLNILDIMRVILILYVIFMHRFAQYGSLPILNQEYPNLDKRAYYYIVLSNTTCIVDTAFCITAMLATKSWLEKLERGENLHFWKSILCRYIRLTPSYAFLIFFYIYALPYIGSGALWAQRVDAEAELCYATWWHNLLYINNYTERLYCAFQSWHLAVDLQAHIILFFVVTLFWKLPRPANYCFLLVLIIASGSLAGYVTCANRFPPTLIFFQRDRRLSELKENIIDIDYFLQFYIKTHLRINPFFVGAATGAVIVEFKKTGRRFPQLWSIVAAVLAILAKIVIQGLVARYVWNVASDAEVFLYGGFHRTIYAALSAVFIIALTFGENTKWLRDFMSPTWICVLRKLSYGVYLCHFINELYDHGSTRASKVASFYNVISETILDTCVALAFSLFLWLAIESPIHHLLKLFPEKRVKETDKSD